MPLQVIAMITCELGCEDGCIKGWLDGSDEGCELGSDEDWDLFNSLVSYFRFWKYAKIKNGLRKKILDPIFCFRKNSNGFCAFPKKNRWAFFQVPVPFVFPSVYFILSCISRGAHYFGFILWLVLWK